MEKNQEPDYILEVIRDKRFTIGCYTYRYSYPLDVRKLVKEGGWNPSHDPTDLLTYTNADVLGLTNRNWDDDTSLPDHHMNYYNEKYGKDNWRPFDLDRIAPTTPSEKEGVFRDVSHQANLSQAEAYALRDVNSLMPLTTTYGVHIYVRSNT